MVKKPKSNALVVKNGALPPAAQVMHFSDEQWENFIELSCLNHEVNGQKYFQVKRLGNAGDAGRDVEARFQAELVESKWDLYQAKHYENRLAPSTAFPELVKSFCHLVAKTYPCPRKYFFCSPKNCGPDLHDLIANPSLFKTTFISAWASGTNGLSKLGALLTDDVRQYVEKFDFSKIEEFLVRDLIELHSKNTQAHYELFGIETERGDDPEIPDLPSNDEVIYITELLSVYTEHFKSTVDLNNISALEVYVEHLSAARANFYCAEGLKRFSRDLYTEDEFSNLLIMVLKGIRPLVLSPKLQDGFDRFDAAMQAVLSININDSKLSSRVRGGDLPGTCHHLVNDKKLQWIKKI